ncbi:uncharacterized protein TNCV_4247991 [Trichonephila clavipes]|nr:uncharacterized protein TNCV_4247991 [Trichonephila clavipes]
MIMMVHGGAPVHFSASVCDWLYMTYPGLWIKRGIPLLCPPRSLDLTPLSYFPMRPSEGISAWGRNDSQTDLVAHLHAACTSVETMLLRRGYSFIQRRAQAYLDMPGRHFEHL